MNVLLFMKPCKLATFIATIQLAKNFDEKCMLANKKFPFKISMQGKSDNTC